MLDLTNFAGVYIGEKLEVRLKHWMAALKTVDGVCDS